jgi:hypothetical protein
MTKKQIRMELSNRQGGKCFWCDKPIGDLGLSDIGRLIPKSQGGNYDLSNLRLLHAVCTQERYGTRR